MGFEVVSDLKKAANELVSFASSFEARAHTPAQCRAISDDALRIERAAKAIRLAASAQALAGEAWRKEGFACPEDWLAHRNGTTTAQAVREAKLAADLESAPATASALARGDISPDQAGLIADAAVRAPGSEAGLLAAAPSKPVEDLRRAAERAKAAARGPEEEAARQARVHASRHLRTWNGPDGAFEASLRMTRADGAVFSASLQPYLARAYEQAHAQGRREGRDALLVDALVSMAKDKSGGGKGPRPVINVRVDEAALRRGYPEKGEMCEIEGLGPIPVSTVVEMANDALLRVLLTDGRDVKLVASSRTATALQKAVLNEAADYRCCVRNCRRRFGLQADHIRPWARGGVTSLENLRLPCAYHHALITHRGLRLVKADDGLWDMVGDEGVVEVPDPPPRR